MKYPLLDYGTPEEEAWRWRFVPWYIRSQRIRDTYLFTVKYYDKTEGEDLLGKIVAINRNTFTYGAMAGIVDATMHKKLKGFQQVAGRIYHWCWPVVGASSAFATVSYFGAKFRGKDDYYNYAAGACAAGSVIGKWQQCHVKGWSAALFFCLAAAAQRIRLEEGWTWWRYDEQEPENCRAKSCH